VTFASIDTVPPAGMKMLAGLTVAFVVSLLFRVIVTPASAAVPSVTGNATDWPGDSVSPIERMMPPILVSVNEAAGEAGGADAETE